MKYNHPIEIPRSKSLFFDWIGDRIPVASPNVKGDTHPMAWADDDKIYIGTGDPNWMVLDGNNYVSDPSRGGWSESPETYKGMSGQVVEVITGEPEAFQVHRVHDMPGYVGPGGGGPKPCGMICVDGKLYYAVQNLLGWKEPALPGCQWGGDATIICSEDHGKTWTPELNTLLGEFQEKYFDRTTGAAQSWTLPEAERTGYQGWEPMFPGTAFGGLSFLQYGKNNEEAVDDYVYAVSGDQWDNGRQLLLGRTPKDRIMDRGAWEFAQLDENGDPIWKKELAEATPILEIPGHIGLPEMVYLPSLKKYLLLTWGLHTNFRTPTGSELTILESDKPWGPFFLVQYDWTWYKRDACPYPPRIPLKWFDNETLEGYLLHSGNWETNMPYYLPQVRKFRLTVRTDDCR